MLVRWSPLHGYVHVLSLENPDNAVEKRVGSSLPNVVGNLQIETFHHGELVRAESGPIHKIKHALVNPQGRYRLTPEVLALACVNDETCAIVARLSAFLFPPKTHYEVVLERALGNLAQRLARGSDLEKATRDVSDLFGVQTADLEEQYQTLYA